MTGCNPGKHGIFDFQGHDRQKRETYFVNATSLRVPTLWQILSEHGRRVAVVDLPVTYPPPPINGVLISGLMTPNRETIFTHPPALRNELKARLGYEWPLLHEEEERGSFQGDFAGFLEQMHLFISSRIEAMLHLLEKEAWDFTFLQFQCVDFLQHPFWKYLEATHPAFHLDRHQEVIRQFFIPLDEALGRLLTAARRSMGEETLMVVLSDHGFQRHCVRVELNHWLHQEGFLAPQIQARTLWMRWAETIRKLDVLELRKKLIHKSRQKAMARSLRKQCIDHERSLAYAISSFWGYLYLNPQASPRDLRRLEDKLREWRDPQDGTKIVKSIFRREQLYHGQALDRLPDLILEPAPGYTFSSKTYFRDGRLFSPVITDDFHVGTHEREGIFVVAGPEVRNAEPWLRAEADLQDMMPTLLHWMELPVPGYCDGQIRHEWFDHAEVLPRVVYDDSAREIAGEVRLSESEQSEIERRLKTLGYM